MRKSWFYKQYRTLSNANNVGTFLFKDPRFARNFDFGRTVDGVYARRMILLSPEARQREGLRNIVFRLSRPAIDDAQHGDPVLSAAHLSRRLLIPPEYVRSMSAKLGGLPTLHEWLAHGGNIVRNPLSLTQFAADWMLRRVIAERKLPSIFLYRKDGSYPLEFNAEQLPLSDSRVDSG